MLLTFGLVPHLVDEIAETGSASIYNGVVLYGLLTFHIRWCVKSFCDWCLPRLCLRVAQCFRLGLEWHSGFLRLRKMSVIEGILCLPFLPYLLTNQPATT